MESLDKDAIRELELFVENDANIYRQTIKPIQKNLITKMAQKKYDSKLAVKAFMYAVEAGAKAYAKQFSKAADWNKTFPKKEREEVAKRMVKGFEAEAKDGEFDDMLPKKYQKK